MAKTKVKKQAGYKELKAYRYKERKKEEAAAPKRARQKNLSDRKERYKRNRRNEFADAKTEGRFTEKTSLNEEFSINKRTVDDSFMRRELVENSTVKRESIESVTLEKELAGDSFIDKNSLSLENKGENKNMSESSEVSQNEKDQTEESKGNHPTFKDLKIREEILRAIEDMGFEEMTPIQSQAIPVILGGSDAVGQAQTGTGKTATFAIPILNKVDPDIRKPQALIICPTRELAIQVAEETRKLARYMSSIRVLPIYGGQEISKQIRSLKAGVQIIVGTPGRIMDHMRRKTIRCDLVNTVVLDEADEMLDMGFREDIETILEEINEDRQTLLFSATMPAPILELTSQYQRNPEMIRVVRKELTVSNITQYYYEVRPKNKVEVLSRLLDIYDPKISIVFCNTKKGVDELVEELQGRGYFAEGLHGDMKQTMRDRVMNGFRKGRTEILVATDVAARGIDVDDVDAVFNYDLPQDEEYYVHRIGRTGRAGKSGMAFSFVVGREVFKLKDIKRYCKAKIMLQPIPSLSDVRELRVEKLFEHLRGIIEEGGLDKYVSMIEEYVNETDFTSMDLAAAFLSDSLGKAENVTYREEDAFGDTGAVEEGMVRLFINIGRKQGIRPGDVLGAIAGESGIPGKLVGSIDIHDRYTFVEVPQDVAEDVLDAMKKVKIKGKTINVEPASAK